MKISAIVVCLGLSALISGCISVNIGPKAPEKSKTVTATPPPAPYVQLESLRADGAWRHPKTGNTISYLSTCNDPADPSIELATNEILAALGTNKTLSQKTLDFQGREALDSVAEAKVEGIPTKIRSLVFKKNGCLYTLTLVGLSKSFATGEGDFETFTKGFSAP